ncbi:hypothetical protein BOTBODRAFT_137742 [Botryobasidium botryosum FD-172 SS1]|uniref:Phospholipase C/P1 nuclease n=1 Tax=Botryobasidium botryosum (strain FD-172 SS1) TaxID=930990 RepID=A0A067M1K4_BOTB1|nr:hypothetical protein BOTBODRAFT_137742 [Botryobasidium botryosum FD-172 SS1]
MRVRNYIPELVALSVSIPHALAWGAAGHQMVGTIAQMFLTPTTKARICDILPENTKCHLAPLAPWADRVRNPYTGPLHYVGGAQDWPPLNCQFPGPGGWENEERNVLVGLLNATMGVHTLTGGEQDFALRYLIHYMGDLHMPLHLTGRDRGGNNDKVRFEGTITNLHSVWDGKLITKSIREMTNYTRPLPSRFIESALVGSIYDPYVRFIVAEGIFGWWRDEWQSWATCPQNERRPSGSRLFWPLSLVSSAQQQQQQQVMGLSDRVSGILGVPDDLPVCPYHWAKPIHQALNCPARATDGGVWPKHLAPTRPPQHPDDPYVELDTPEYVGAIQNAKVVEKVLAMAGVRLAAVLNTLLDPQGGGAQEGLKVRWNTMA